MNIFTHVHMHTQTCIPLYNYTKINACEHLFHKTKIKTPIFKFAMKIKIKTFKAITNPKHTNLRFIKIVRLCTNWLEKHNIRSGTKSIY